MTLYRAAFAPLGPVASPLQGDTFFGAFCWSCRARLGEDYLKEQLHGALEGRPFITFSNAYPAGYLPLPFGVLDSALAFSETTDRAVKQTAYRQRKKLKRTRLIPVERFLRLAAGETAGFSQSLRGDGLHTLSAPHASIGRGEQKVDLFTTEVTFLEPPLLEVYLRTELAPPLLEALLTQMFLLGIGAGKSSGKGLFRLERLERCDFPTPAGANAFVALGNFIPAARDPVDGWYKTMTKFPRVDRQFATEGMPYKTPVLMLRAGSLFRDSAPRELYGRCLGGVSPLSPDIIMNACTPVLPLYID